MCRCRRSILFGTYFRLIMTWKPDKAATVQEKADHLSGQIVCLPQLQHSTTAIYLNQKAMGRVIGCVQSMLKVTNMRMKLPKNAKMHLKMSFWATQNDQFIYIHDQCWDLNSRANLGDWPSDQKEAN